MSNEPKMLELDFVTELSERVLEEHGYVRRGLPQKIGNTWRFRYMANGRYAAAFLCTNTDPLEAEVRLRGIISSPAPG